MDRLSFKGHSQPNGDSHVYMSGIQIPSLFDSSTDYFRPYINNFNPDIELNILEQIHLSLQYQ